MGPKREGQNCFYQMINWVNKVTESKIEENRFLNPKESWVRNTFVANIFEITNFHTQSVIVQHRFV